MEIKEALPNDALVPQVGNRLPLSLREFAYQEVERLIFTKAVGPNQRLNVDEIASSLGISRTPVREALQDLAREGLIEIRRSRGVYLRSFTAQDIEDNLDVRRILEPIVASRAATRISSDELDRLDRSYIKAQEAVAMGEVQAHFQFDNQIHDLVHRYAGNRLLGSLLKQVRNQSRCMRLLYSARRLDQTVHSQSELFALLEALRQSNGADARRAMEIHLKNSLLRMRENLDTAGESIKE